MTGAKAKESRLERHRVALAAISLLFVCANAAAVEGFRIGGTGCALGTMQLLANEFNAANPGVLVSTVPSLTSSGGIKAVLDGVIGLGLASRPMKDNERKLGAVETEYARTPFVFAVSVESGVRAISSAELAGIYAGKMTTWADGSPIRVVLRPQRDIETELVRGMSPAIRAALPAAQTRRGVRVAASDQDAANDLEEIPGAIGPSTLTLIVSENRALRPLELDGVEPTPGNAASGVYPYYKRLFFVTGAKRAALVERFIAFVRSPAGREILLRNGNWMP